MQKTLLASLALAAVVATDAAAQTCVGMPAFASGPVQVSGLSAFTDGANSFGGSVGYGRPASLFAKASVSSTSTDAFDSSELGVGAQVGYQIAMGEKKQFELCPVASAQYGFGYSDVLVDGDELSNRGLTAGLSLGTALGSSGSVRFVPNAGLHFVYSQLKYETALGSDDTSDSYGLATLGLGLVFSESFGLAPSVSFPIGLDGSDPSFGLTGSIHFGR